MQAHGSACILEHSGMVQWSILKYIFNLSTDTHLELYTQLLLSLQLNTQLFWYWVIAHQIACLKMILACWSLRSYKVHLKKYFLILMTNQNFSIFLQLLRLCSHSWFCIQQITYLIFSARSHVTTAELTDFSLDPMANENLVSVPWHHHSMDHQF